MCSASGVSCRTCLERQVTNGKPQVCLVEGLTPGGVGEEGRREGGEARMGRGC